MRPFAAGLLALALFAPTLWADDPAVKALLDRATKAQGGADKAATLSNVTLKGKGQFNEGGQTADMSFDLSLKDLTNARMELTVTAGGMTNKGTMVFVADKGWFRDANRDKVEEAPKDAVPAIQTVLMAIRAPSYPAGLSGQKNLQMAHGGEAKVDDTPAEVLRISRKDLPDITVYYDKKTGLPLKSESTIKEPNGQEKPFVFQFTEFKEFDGVKVFTKVKVVADGKDTFDLELSDIKGAAKFEANTFDKP